MSCFCGMLLRIFLPSLGRSIAAALVVGLALISEGASAADPQPYAVTLGATGDSALDETLSSASVLEALRDRAPVPPFGLIERARGDIERLTTVLNSFGYYSGKVTITVAGHALDDAALLPLLDEAPAGKPVDVSIAIDKGQLYRLRKIEIVGTLPPEARAALRLMPGDPAIATDIAAAQIRVLTALRESGYAFAEIQEPAAYADDDAYVLDLSFEVNPGAKATIGAISFQGLSSVNESFVANALTIHSGDPYKPSAIDAARQALAATGVFTAVSVKAGERPMADGGVPLTFVFQERPAHAVNFSGAYSTDLGVTLSAGWSHRNLFGNGEQLNLSAAETGLGGDATGGLGYKLVAQFIKPFFLRQDQTLQLDAGAIRQDLLAYDQKAISAGATLRRKLSPAWTVSAGTTVIEDDVAQQGTDRIYQLLAFPLTAAYDTTGLTDPLLDPLHGIRASFVVTPTESFGARTNTFAVLQALASTYIDLSGNGRSVLALRGQVGLVAGASNLDLPPDQRLYAGGSATVRGFRYQSIGPLFPDGNPVGATSVDAATIEMRQRLFGNYGVAAFVDAGQASTYGSPFTGPLRVGSGVGARYYTSIGAVRVDVAFPLAKVPNGDSFELYIGLGQAF